MCDEIDFDIISGCDTVDIDIPRISRCEEECLGSNGAIEWDERKRTAFGTFSQYNGEVVHAIKHGWLSEKGELTQKGRDVLASRKPVHPYEGDRTPISLPISHQRRVTPSRVSGIGDKHMIDPEVEDRIETALAKRGVNGNPEVRVKSQRGQVLTVVIVLHRSRKAGGRTVLRLFGTLPDLVRQLEHEDFKGVTGSRR